MRIITIAALSCLVHASACSKDKAEPESATTEAAATETEKAATPETEPSEAGDSAAKVAETATAEAPAAGGMPADWKEYRNEKSGYRIMAPVKPPKPTNFGDDPDAAGMVVTGEEFMFADCFGQVLFLEYTGKETFDVEKGMDGGIEKMLSNVNGKVTESTKKALDGRPARQYRVDGNWKGTAISGLGRGIAVNDTTILVVNAFWQATDKGCPAMGEQFVNSLSPISKK